MTEKDSILIDQEGWMKNFREKKDESNEGEFFICFSLK